jgi:RNA 3'-terminal phosphate cyclase (ATP)
MTNHLHINGKQGEGGGQVVRSSIALALVTGQPIRISNIRARRSRPGLAHQHVAAVQAAAEICGGSLSGAEIGSRALNFEPGPARAGTYRFRVGTAGSATLVLQTVLPALLLADGTSHITLEGGTHNQWAPPFDFLQRAFLPLVNRMGPRVSATLERHGFYPAGGGRISVTIEPSATLSGFDLLERGPLLSRTAYARVANLPLHIAQREVQTLTHELAWDDSCAVAEEVDAHGPGNVTFVELVSQHATEVFTGFGRLGVRAEYVAQEVAQEATAYLRSDVPVGPYLADQLLLPLGISAWQSGDSDRQRGGSFRTLSLTRHATTHIKVLQTFLAIDVAVAESAGDGTCCVRLKPSVSN